MWTSTRHFGSRWAYHLNFWFNTPSSAEHFSHINFKNNWLLPCSVELRCFLLAWDFSVLCLQRKTKQIPSIINEYFLIKTFLSEKLKYDWFKTTLVTLSTLFLLVGKKTFLFKKVLFWNERFFPKIRFSIPGFSGMSPKWD